MIYPYAIELEVVLTWLDRSNFRFIRDRFGLGTARVLFELPKFSKWKKAVYDVAEAQGLSDTDMTKLAELFQWLGTSRLRRDDGHYVTNIGGVNYGNSLEDGKPGQTADFNTLVSEKYAHHWLLRAQEQGLDLVDRPKLVEGTKRVRR